MFNDRLHEKRDTLWLGDAEMSRDGLLPKENMGGKSWVGILSERLCPLQPRSQPITDGLGPSSEAQIGGYSGPSCK